VDEGKAVDVVYMDFSKAFDKVPHGRQLQKYEGMELRMIQRFGSGIGCLVEDRGWWLMGKVHLGV